ncbi:S-adenosyl-L-methionine-dependent methyltransferase [Terfezia boudieri ATCC MYA-4762]|uniref:tRNA (adenine(58)-N(1))-methyltransferase catalytic subunit TRM61 n=1 Tax=Terfezia boudieri ATCC MYA-4762 TaxID=1051890 RepID=A0A3N4LSB0_9PEZI|nr:S-adenosyl-L-methionine-dependent methyltransferase [Terfezia boudieri ATCC MYA-4762]
MLKVVISGLLHICAVAIDCSQSGPFDSALSSVIAHLRRNQLLELNPSKTTPNETLYTRFGHFPHKTLLGFQCDSQRKRDVEAEIDGAGGDAPSGFIHVLAPTPELWTISLPHRTQVVYTADSSYILHRLRTRPGIHIIEAGAGSGSFTHAAVHGVYTGYPTGNGSKGKAFSYEYHASRAEKLREEIREHGLEALVEVAQGDVYICEEDHQKSPEATAVFLDLPAPW